jgi:ferredoxin
MGFVKVDPKKCVKDGICAQECPVMLISLNGGSKYPEAIDGAEERCIKC